MLCACLSVLLNNLYVKKKHVKKKIQMCTVYSPHLNYSSIKFSTGILNSYTIIIIQIGIFWLCHAVSFSCMKTHAITFFIPEVLNHSTIGSAAAVHT